MSVFVGSDGYGHFVIGWSADDAPAAIWAKLTTGSAHQLRQQLSLILRDRDVEDELRMARRELDVLRRSNASLRGALKRKKKRRS